MISLSLLDIKTLTTNLFIQDMFDKFYMTEAEITTFAKYHIDGRRFKDYYTKDELEIMGERPYCLWSEIKPLAYDMIKGRKLPLRFRITFKLPDEGLHTLIKRHPIRIPIDQVDGVCLNLKYESNRITCVTGVSYNTFIMDKTLDELWDDTVRGFFRQNKITFE